MTMMVLSIALGAVGAALIGLSLWLRKTERRASSDARDLDGVPWTRLEAHGPGRVVEARTLRVELPDTLRKPLSVPGVRGGVVPGTLLVRTVMLEWDLPTGARRARFRTHHLIDGHGREITAIYARGKRDFNGERTHNDGWFTEGRGARMCKEIERRGAETAETIATFQPVGSGLVLTTTFARRHKRPAGVAHTLCSIKAPLEPIRSLSPREAAALKVSAVRRSAA